MAAHVEPEVVWRPPHGATSRMDEYRQHVNKKFNQDLHDTRELQRWSVSQTQEFWIDLYGYLGLLPHLLGSTKKAYDDSIPMSQIPAFFPGLEINYAENILFANKDPEAIALIGITEEQEIGRNPPEIITWRQFREKVREIASALKRSGIKKGDRVAALVATSNWAVLLFHASASIGAIFTSISPELGVEGCVTRLQQVNPSILFVDSHAVYKGKAVSTAKKLKDVLHALNNCPQVFVICVTVSQSDGPTMNDFLRQADPSDALTFTRVPFNYPLMICYTSGTTGAPKCIVHQHGLIIQMKKASSLHDDLGPEDTVMQYTSTSWAVFYIACGHLSTGATLVVYNGSPLFPDAKQLLRVSEAYRVTFLGVSPRWLLEVEISRTVPKDEFDLSPLRMVYTAGAPLLVEQYRWFYRSFPSTVQLCNSAGGTDTATSILAPDPCSPVYAGEMQVPGLGMDVDIFDPETGDSITHTGQAGEMVIRKPFPSMPCFFWGDVNNKLYRAAYFERFQQKTDVWAQHDWLSRNAATGGYTMHGRSDGVLNPSGVRFGSGEIYAIVESEPFTEVINNTLCVGRRRPKDGDEQVFLFLVMKPGVSFTEELRSKIKGAIREGLSPRHVPKFVLAVPDIPVTINGKKIETAIKNILCGKDVKPSSTVQNPNTFAWFKQFRDIESEPRDSRL